MPEPSLTHTTSDSTDLSGICHGVCMGEGPLSQWQGWPSTPCPPCNRLGSFPFRATTGCRAVPPVEKGKETQTHPSSIFPPADSQGQQNPDGASPPQPHPTRTHTLSLPPLSVFLCVKWVDCWFRACTSPISISRPFPFFPALAWRVRDQDPRRPKGHSHPLYPPTAVPTASMVTSVAKTGPGPLQLS